MNKNKLEVILSYVATLCWYILSIIKFTGGNSQKGVMGLCLGSAMLCCGSAALNKYRKNDDKPENKDEDKPEDHE